MVSSYRYLDEEVAGWGRWSLKRRPRSPFSLMGFLFTQLTKPHFSVLSTTAVFMSWGQPLAGWLFCLPASLEVFLLLLPGNCLDFGTQGFLGQSWAPVSISLGLQWWDSSSYPFYCLAFTKDLQFCWWLRLQPSPWLPSVNNHSLRGIFHLDVTNISRSSLRNMKSHKEMSTHEAKEQFHSLTKLPKNWWKQVIEVWTPGPKCLRHLRWEWCKTKQNQTNPEASCWGSISKAVL